ncbi:hypothetical protein BA6E_104160 [Bacteroidales bacterium 6E]|nr:hypothetical protein BA6E_104160 [Bacteroidales bacterium 6E]
MGLHSKFLVHWTGKEFKSDDSKNIVDRLKDNLSHGLYMNTGSEFMIGSNNTTVTTSVSRVCFTEIRLSQAKNHSDSYGKLGIGFNREFVLERMGGPVFYVQNGENGAVVEHFAYLHQHLRSNENQIMVDRLNTIMGFMKNMSVENDSELKYYEEMEWRIIQLKILEDNQLIKVQNKEMGIYRVIFKPEDIELIVFPNKETKQLAVQEDFIKHFFKDHLPVIATIDECLNF